MYMPHMGAQSLRVKFAAPSIANKLAQVTAVGGNSSYGSIDPATQLAGLQGSASVLPGSNGKTITLTVVNPHLHNALTTEIAIGGASIASVRGTVLTDLDPHAHNDFDHPNAVKPAAAATGSPAAGRLMHRFPPASVSALTLTLA